MSDLQYFIPEISDIRVGYDYERFNGNDWVKYNFREDSPMCFDTEGWRFNLQDDIEIHKIRVPYLTKEQIESEGWILDRPEMFGDRAFKKDGYYTMLYNYDDYEIRIHSGKHELNLFHGYCKCVNEFRYIMKLLNI